MYIEVCPYVISHGLELILYTLTTSLFIYFERLFISNSIPFWMSAVSLTPCSETETLFDIRIPFNKIFCVCLFKHSTTEFYENSTTEPPTRYRFLNDFILFTLLGKLILRLIPLSSNFIILKENFNLLCLIKTNFTNLRLKMFPMPGIEHGPWR